MLTVLTLAVGLAAAPQQPQAPPPPPVLTLPQAVAQARAASPLRAAAAAAARGSVDAARLAGRMLNPVIDVRVENFGTATRTTLPLDTFATLSQALELGGKRGLRLDAAEADRDIAAASLSMAEWQVGLRTAQLYVQALRARGLLETLTANRDGLETLVVTMRRRVEEGYAAESDLLKLQTESARMETDIARIRIELGRSLNALTFIVGTASALDARQLEEPRPLAPPRLEAAALPGFVAKHPELALANARLERTRRTLELERAKRLPDPLLTAGYKRTNGFNTALAGVTMSVPLFDRNASATAKATGEERAAVADRDAVATRLASEVPTLVATAQTLAERSTRAARELLEPAETVRAAARSAFREGAADVLKLIDAERVYSEVRRVVLELRLEALGASLEAHFASGEETLR